MPRFLFSTPAPRPAGCLALTSRTKEDHKQSELERRVAFRPDVSICRCQPVQSTHQPDLEAVRRHHLPRRLRSKLYAATAGAGRSDQPCFGAKHDATACCFSARSSTAGAIERV